MQEALRVSYRLYSYAVRVLVRVLYVVAAGKNLGQGAQADGVALYHIIVRRAMIHPALLSQASLYLCFVYRTDSSIILVRVLYECHSSIEYGALLSLSAPGNALSIA